MKEKDLFIIAEMSGNHNQSLEQALRIVDAAADAGAHALKLQTYTADTLTIDCDKPDFQISDSKSLWQGENLYGLYKKAYTPWEWHQPIFQRCRERGMIGFSTPFDETAVDFLEGLDVSIYKIASFELNHHPLLKKVAATRKPVIASVGMATVSEIDKAVRVLRESGCPDITLLKCTSTYPASPEDTNLRTIPHLKDLFGCEVGLSDHTMGIGVSVAAIAFGVRVIEKHFTISRAEGGVDSAFSMEPAEFRLLVDEARRAAQALGDVHYGPTDKEKASLVYRRSIYAVEDIKAGESLSQTNIRVIRPGFGLAPEFYETVLGSRITKDVQRGTALSWDIFK